MVDQGKVRAMKAWIERRRKRKPEPNADEIWAEIKKRWPHSPQEEWEAVFKESN